MWEYSQIFAWELRMMLIQRLGQPKVGCVLLQRHCWLEIMLMCNIPTCTCSPQHLAHVTART